MKTTSLSWLYVAVFLTLAGSLIAESPVERTVVLVLLIVCAVKAFFGSPIAEATDMPGPNTKTDGATESSQDDVEKSDEVLIHVKAYLIVAFGLLGACLLVEFARAIF